jgi:hypothetical protein
MARRDEWAKRIEQWAESGLTGTEFARELGVKEGTLRHWKWELDRPTRPRRAAAPPPRRAQFVELIAPTTQTSTTSGIAASPEPFELVLGNGLRVRVPARFDPDALCRLLGAVGDR